MAKIIGYVNEQPVYDEKLIEKEPPTTPSSNKDLDEGDALFFDLEAEEE